MANGWARLGEAFAGLSDAQRSDIQAKTQQQLAARDNAIAGAWMKMDEARNRGLAEETYARMVAPGASEEDRARAIATLQRGGLNPNTGAGALGKLFEQSVRSDARDAALAGDFGGANANLFGIASGPQQLAQIQGDTVIGNRYVPGGDIRGPTSIGSARIERLGTQMLADRALANQRNQPRSSGGGSRSSAAPKLSEIDKMRLNTELKPLQSALSSAQADLDDIQSSSRVPHPARMAQAQDRVAALQEQINSLFDRYEPAREGVDFVIDDPENMPPQLVSAIRDQAKSLGEQFGGAQDFSNVSVSSSGSSGAAPVISSQQQYNSLPSGALFRAPDGTTRRKP